MKRFPLSIALAFALAAGAVHAQPTAADKQRAKEAYERGVDAHKRGDMQKAAEEFAKADSLAPSPVALQAALDAAVEADDPALGAELLERSNREPASGALAGSVQTARTKLGGRAGRVRVLCPASAKVCVAKLDERFVDADKAVWAKTGPHTIVIQVDGETQTKLIELKADQMMDVVPAAKTEPVKPPPTAPTPDPAKQPPQQPTPVEPEKPSKRVATHGLPRIIFFAGIGATVLLGGATTYLALDTKRKHDDFTESGCERANYLGCEDKKEEGERAQELTNIGIVATALAGVATAVIGIAFTDWGGPVITATPNGFQGAWTKKF